MEWYWWLILCLLIIYIINKIIKLIAKKINCFNIMNSISDNEFKGMTNIIFICISTISFLAIMNYSIPSIEAIFSFFLFTIVLFGILPTIVKFFMAIYKKSKGVKDEVKINNSKELIKNNEEKLINIKIEKKQKRKIKKDNKNDEKLEKEMEYYSLEDWQKELVRKGEFYPWNFEEEDLEDEDYYSEDDPN